MNRNVWPFIIAFALGIAMALPGPAPLRAQEAVLLVEAINDGRVEARITGRSSTYFQPMVAMEVRNLSEQGISIDFPVGSILTSEEGEACDLVHLTSDPSTIFLQPEAEVIISYRLFTYCLDLVGQGRSFPSAQSTYLPTGELVSQEVLDVLNNIQENGGQETFAAQIAVWSAATGLDVAQLEEQMNADYSLYTGLVAQFTGAAPDALPPAPEETSIPTPGDAPQDTSGEAPASPEESTPQPADPVPAEAAGEEIPENSVNATPFLIVLVTAIIGAIGLFAFMLRQPQRRAALATPAVQSNPRAADTRKAPAGGPKGPRPTTPGRVKAPIVRGDEPTEPILLVTDETPNREVAPTRQDDGRTNRDSARARPENRSAPPVHDHVATEPIEVLPRASTWIHEPTEPIEFDPEELLNGEVHDSGAESLTLYLEVIKGDQKGQEYSIVGSPHGLQGIISRGEAGQITLPHDAKVSMPHAVLDIAQTMGQPGKIRDLGSQNGTFVNGEKISAHGWKPLRDGDLLQFGSTRLRYQQARQQLVYEDNPHRAESLNGSSNRWLISRQAIESIHFESGDTAISVPHVYIRMQNGLLEVRDLSSKNGVKVQGRRIDKREPIFNGDVIQFGRETEIKVVTDIPNLPGEINGWRLESLIGSGGMAHVYRVRAVDDARQCRALKIPRPDKFRLNDLWGEKFRELFPRECTLSAEIQDENLVKALETGELPGLGIPYLMLQYIDGPSVYAIIEKLHTFSVADAAEVAIQVGRALRVCHLKHNYVHCDVKPSNILIDRHGNVYLADLGVATRVGEPFSGLGAKRYLPQEVKDNAPVNFDTDVYSLGQTLFEMLTSYSPGSRQDQDGVGVRVTDVMKNSEPPPTSTLLRTTIDSEDMQRIIRKCIDPNRLDRYQEITTLLQDLEPLRAGANLKALVDRTGWAQVNTQRLQTEI